MPIVRPNPSCGPSPLDTRRLWPVLVAAAGLVAPAPAAAQAPRQILILYSLRHDLPVNQTLDAKLRAAFREGLGDRVEVSSEYINAGSFPGRDGHRKLLEFLRHKYAPRRVDLILAVGSVALDAVQDNRDWFSPDTPVVYLGVAEAEAGSRTIRAGVTGIPVRLDFGESARVALRLRPGTRRVVVVAGAGPHETSFADAARRDLRPLEDRAEFVYLVGLPMDELLGEVSRLPGDALILFVGFSRDGAGRSFRDAIDRVAAVAPVPVFGAFDSYLGHGIVGGHMVSFEGEADNAARLGLRILAGEDPAAVAAGSATACTHTFDWRELRRWGIDEARLPPGSVVRFRSPGVWDHYKWHIVAVLAVTVLEGVTIAWLLAARVRRRRAEAALAASETERKRAAADLLASSQRQRDLASQLLTAQEGERRRIAREMHDDLTQRLAVLAIEVNKLERLPGLDGAAARLGGIREQLVGLSEDVHDLSRRLHPSILDDLGLADALRAECTLFQDREGVETRYEAGGVPADLPREVCLGLYRIAQEAMRNVARHAGVTRAEVSLLGTGPDVLLTVSDGGKGFERGGRAWRSGVGLASMEERARLIGAELTVRSAPGEGTVITVLVSRSGGRP